MNKKQLIKRCLIDADAIETYYKLSASVRWGIWGKYSNIKPILAILGC